MHIIFTPVPGNQIIRARLEKDGLIINGQLHPWDAAPEVVEYGEEGGLQELVSLQNDHTFKVIPSTWVDPNPPKPVEPDPQEALDTMRSTWVAHRWQLRAALGEQRCAVVDGIAARAYTPWVVKTAIRDAQTISRNSPTIAMLAQALGMDAAAVDALFLEAMALTA